MFSIFNKDKTFKRKFKEYANELERLGYFSWAEKEDIIAQFIATGTSIKKVHPILNERTDNDVIQSLDKRSFYCDATNLFNASHFELFLESLKPSFAAMQIPFDVESILGGWDSQNLEYNLSVIINSTPYVLLDKFHNGPLGTAVYETANMLNDILQKANSKNNVYLTGHGSIIALYILTVEQYNCISKFYTSEDSQPISPELWQKKAEKRDMVFFKNT